MFHLACLDGQHFHARHEIEDFFFFFWLLSAAVDGVNKMVAFFKITVYFLLCIEVFIDAS